MRDSEDLAFALHCANAKSRGLKAAEIWEMLFVEDQKAYLAMVNAAFAWLFEPPGRISQFISCEQLQAASEQYKAHLIENEP